MCKTVGGYPAGCSTHHFCIASCAIFSPAHIDVLPPLRGSNQKFYRLVQNNIVWPRSLPKPCLNTIKGTDQLEITEVVENYYTTEQVAQIIKRSLPFVKIGLEGELDAERFTLRLPLEMRGKFPEFGARTVVPVTTRRRDWRAESETVLLDFSTTFVQFLIQTITSAEFGGAYAAFAIDPTMPEFFSVFLARYQNDQGRPQGEKLIVVDRDSDGSIEVSNRIIARLLEGPQSTGLPRPKDAALRRSELDAASDRAEIVMAEDLSRFRHPNDLIVIAVGESATPPQ
jgi:hypothetical protein